MSSNNILKYMYVFPDNFKTWSIGDGYFDNPYYNDVYYFGPKWGGFYMATDVGYLRFIFYFGVIGLALFIAFFCKSTHICIRRFKEYKIFFLMLVAVNFIVWFKVSTDIFLVFALFLCLNADGSQSEAKTLAEIEE